MADLMVLGADGTVRTSGWSYHNRQDLGADWVPNSGVDSAPAAILTAIRATSDRHAGNRGLRTVGLSSRGWHILFQALVEAESDYDPGATSRKGAYGLGQLMPETALALGVDRRDVAQNLDGAARYLLAQIADFRDIDLALAAYNAGPHRVREFDGCQSRRKKGPFAGVKVGQLRCRALLGVLPIKLTRDKAHVGQRPTSIKFRPGSGSGVSALF